MLKYSIFETFIITYIEWFLILHVADYCTLVKLPR